MLEFIFDITSFIVLLAAIPFTAVLAVVLFDHRAALPVAMLFAVAFIAASAMMV